MHFSKYQDFTSLGRGFEFTLFQTSPIHQSNFEELLQKMESVSFAYQIVKCLSTLFKYRFSSNCLLKCRGCLFGIKKQNNGWSAKLCQNRLSRIKQKRNPLGSIQRMKSNKTIASVSATRIEQVRRVKISSEQTQILFCLPDRYF